VSVPQAFPPPAFPPLGAEFEPFLYAVLCIEGNGMPLTLNSVIARSGGDPWTEAARIAKLPRDAALDALTRMIPERSGSEKADIAKRLLALLPTARDRRKNLVDRVSPAAPGWNPVVPVVLALLLGLALVALFKKAPHVGEELLAPPALPAVSTQPAQQEPQ
jgi:hypothetical protein